MTIENYEEDAADTADLPWNAVPVRLTDVPGYVGWGSILADADGTVWVWDGAQRHYTRRHALSPAHIDEVQRVATLARQALSDADDPQGDER